MTTVIVFSLVLGTTLATAASERMDEDAVLERFEKECAGKKKLDIACEEQRKDVEVVFFQTLRRLTAPRKKGAVERGQLVFAAQSEHVGLRELALWTLAAEGTKRGPAVGSVNPVPGYLTREEEKLFAAELNSPYPALRRVAWAALRLKDRKTDQAQWGVDRAYRKAFAGFWRGAPMGLSADRPPHPDQLRAAPYPGAEIQYYANGSKGAVWLTRDSVDKVAAFYKKQGMAAINGEELTTRLQKYQKAKMAEIVKKIQSGMKPEVMEAEMKALEKLQKALAPPYVFAERHPKEQLMLGTERSVGDVRLVEYRVVIWPAKALKRTGIAIETKTKR